MRPPPVPALKLVGQAAGATVPAELRDALRRDAEAAATAEWTLTWRPAVPALHLMAGEVRAEGWTACWAVQRTGLGAVWLLAPDPAAALAEAVFAPAGNALEDLLFGLDLRRDALGARNDALLGALAGMAAGLPHPARTRDDLAEAEHRLGMTDAVYRISSDYGGVWLARWAHHELDPAITIRTGAVDSEFRARALAIILLRWAATHPTWPLTHGTLP